MPLEGRKSTVLQQCSCNKPNNTCYKVFTQSVQRLGRAEQFHPVTSWPSWQEHRCAQPSGAIHLRRTCPASVLGVTQTRAVTSASKSGGSSGSAAGGCGGCPCAVVAALQLLHSKRGKVRVAHSGTQGSTGCWPTRETPHPFASSWEFNHHISPLDNCWRGQAGFPSLQPGVVQQFPTATQPMSQEESSDTAVWWPPPVWLVTGITWTDQN